RIKGQAAGNAVPPGLDDPAKLVIGAGHYAAHCAVCHGAPGVPKGDFARGLYPPPPDLAKTAPLYNPAELFWIVKHGIKMTGMPAWSDHSDEELWATVAFLEKLPGMSEPDYAHLCHGKHGPWRRASLSCQCALFCSQRPRLCRCARRGDTGGIEEVSDGTEEIHVMPGLRRLPGSRDYRAGHHDRRTRKHCPLVAPRVEPAGPAH